MAPFSRATSVLAADRPSGREARPGGAGVQSQGGQLPGPSPGRRPPESTGATAAGVACCTLSPRAPTAVLPCSLVPRWPAPLSPFLGAPPAPQLLLGPSLGSVHRGKGIPEAGVQGHGSPWG